MCARACVCDREREGEREGERERERDRERELIFVSIHTFSRANLFAYEPCLDARKVSVHSLLIVLTRQTMTLLLLFSFYQRTFIFQELGTKPCGKTTTSLSVCHAACRGVVTSQIAANVTSTTFGSCFVLNPSTTVCVPAYNWQ